jgi:hypothetical protein
MWNIGRVKYKQYYLYIEIYTEHVSTSGTGKETKGRRKEAKDYSKKKMKYITSVLEYDTRKHVK